MARIVLGLATSHTPMLNLTAQQWQHRAEVDYANARLNLSDGRRVTYEQLLAERGPRALGDMVANHMTERVVTAHEGTTINALMQKMTSGRFRHVPIVEGGKLQGLVSIGDVVNHRLVEFEAEQRALKDYIATA